MTDQSEKEIYRVLLRIVLPVGSAVWAFTQLVTEPPAVVGLALLAIMAVGIFAAFRTTIAITDDRLNGGAA